MPAAFVCCCDSSLRCPRQGFLTLTERFHIVWTNFGQIPDELGEYCIQRPMHDAEFPWLSKFVEQHSIVMQPAVTAKLLQQVHVYASPNSFPVCCKTEIVDQDRSESCINVRTPCGDLAVFAPFAEDRLLISKVPESSVILGCIRIRFISSLYDNGKFPSVGTTEIWDTNMLPLEIDFPHAFDVAIVSFSNIYGKNLDLNSPGAALHI